MPSFFDLMKYARTGIASPDMTGFDKLRAKAAFGGYPVSTITGVPPISFKADGKPLTAWSIAGNGQQTGTPTPDAPIMPTFCGVRTGNLCGMPRVTFAIQSALSVISTGDTIAFSGTVGEITSGNSAWKQLDFWLDSGDYILSLGAPRIYSGGYAAYLMAYDAGTRIATISGGTVSSAAFTLEERTHVYIAFYIYNRTLTDDKWVFMLNTGSTALPYEPYGYKIPITNAGQTVPVYLGQTQTVRKIKKLVLTGEENWGKSLSTNSFYLAGTQNANSNRALTLCSHFAYSGQTKGEFGSYYTPPTSDHQFNFAWTDSASIDDWRNFLRDEYAAGTPVTVWYVLATPQTAIVNEPLCKIGDYADELHSTDAGVTIPTVRGSNTLIVETVLQPSAVSVTGHIKSS